ncbi:MAG TPA: hypothetical protein VFF30_09950 [Nitrososphaerales archaeon]|nr:hypothetical protein [Nitrososphaerales archaeon]
MNQANRMISLLLVLQVFSTGFLWTLDALNQVSEGIFALFVAVDLLAFAMVSYIYRAEKLRASPSRAWVLVGCIILIAIVFASLAIH